MIQHAKVRDTVTVRLDGELDHYTAERVRLELDDLIADEKVKRLIVDMRALTFMDSSGIGVLIGRYRTLSRRHGTMTVCNMNPHVDRILQMSGIYQIIEKSRSQEDAR